MTELVALPYAGASGTAYRDLAGFLAPDVTVRAVTLPGRGARTAEESLTDLEAVVDDVLGRLDEAGPAEGGYVLFGHSMGALVAYETARRLPVAGRGSPRSLVVSGLDAPHRLRPAPGAPRHELPDDALVSLVRDFGGTPPELLHHGVLRHFLPILRADLEVVDCYRFQPGPRLACPVLCYRGRSDPGMTGDGASAWREVTSGPFRLREFEGDHFYLRDTTALGAALQADLGPGA